MRKTSISLSPAAYDIEIRSPDDSLYRGRVELEAVRELKHRIRQVHMDALIAEQKLIEDFATHNFLDSVGKHEAASVAHLGKVRR